MKGIALFMLMLLVGCSMPSQTTTPEAQATIPLSTPTAITPTTAPTHSPTAIITLSFQLLGRPAAYNDPDRTGTSPDRTGTSPDRTGTSLGAHPALWDLQRWQGRLYLAHGDWYVNSGPLRLLYYDLDTGEFVQDDGYLLEQHAIEIFRVFDDILYIPGVEAIERQDNGYIYRKSEAGAWERLAPISGGVHLWDVMVLNQTIVVIGQTRERGAVWVSQDSGLSWEDSPDFQSGKYGMPQSGFVLHDKIYVTTSGTGCLVFDGQGWAESDCLASNIFEGTAAVQKHALFQGAVAMAPYWATVDERVHFFDGDSRWTVAFSQPVHDVVASADALFVLTGDPAGLGAIYAAESLDCRCIEDFARLADLDFHDDDIPVEDDPFMRLTLGSTPHSLEYVGGRFYIGLADGRLYQSSAYQP